MFLATEDFAVVVQLAQLEAHELIRLGERLFEMPDGMAGLTANETGGTPVMQSFARVMGAQEGRPKRRVDYVKLSSGDGENAAPHVEPAGQVSKSRWNTSSSGSMVMME